MNDKIFLIEAIIRPQRLEAVLESLYELQVDGVTVTEVKGCGRQKAISHTFRGSQYAHNLSPKVKVEVVLEEKHMDEVIRALEDAAQTGEVGDGKIFAYQIHQAVRIRTGERGPAAIS